MKRTKVSTNAINAYDENIIQPPMPKINIMIEGAKIGVCNVDDAASVYSNEPMSSVSTNDHSTGICEITSESDEEGEEEEYDTTNIEPEYDFGQTNYKEPKRSTAESVLGKRRFLTW